MMAVNGSALMRESWGDPVLGRTLLGEYVVERKLGHGGMGSVYLLRSTVLPDSYLALKVLGGADGSRATQDVAERFRQEALAAAAVGSHRVVKPIVTGRFDDGAPYIVMEYVDGRSLAQELKARGPLPVETALKIAHRVADTMAIAHQKGVIHRDLKPPNIMLAREGDRDHVVKLLDFGVARTSGELKVAHTVERAVIGTPGYMSPEAAAALGADGRSDVFSLGVILFEMLTGELPFPAPSVQAATMNVLTQPTPAIGPLRPPHLAPVPPPV